MATVYSTLLYFTFKIKKKKQWQHRKDGQIDQQDCRSQSSPQEQAWERERSSKENLLGWPQNAVRIDQQWLSPTRET